MSDEDETPQIKRTTKTARLPQATLTEVAPVLNKLSELGVAGSKARIAQMMGTTTASSGFKTKVASAGYYGFIEVADGKLKLTERGEAAAGDDPSASLLAKRQAVLSTNFGTLIVEYKTRKPNDVALASRLQDDYAVPAGSAPTVTKKLLVVAEEAGLIRDGVFDAEAIENAEASTPKAKSGTAAKPSVGSRAEKPATTPKRERDSGAAQHAPFGVQVVLKVDASHLDKDEIVDLLKELAKVVTVDS